MDSKGQFMNNETTGVWEFYYETGNLKMRGILRQMLVQQPATRHPNRHAVVTLVQLTKTVDVAAAGRLYEFCVRVLQSVAFPTMSRLFVSLPISASILPK